MMNIEKLTQALNPEIITRFKEAIEIGRWPDGKKLSPEQLETCMQAVIAYEHKTLCEEERTGYVPPKATPCETEDSPSPIKWQK